MKSSAMFQHRWMPLALAAPQLIIVFLFFFWPAWKAIWWSFHLVRPFGNDSVFVSVKNYLRILGDDSFYSSLQATLIFTAGSLVLAIFIAIVLAACAELNLRGRKIFRHLFIWPYAVAGAALGVILKFVMNPVLGPMAILNGIWPGFWTPHINGSEAMLMLIFAFAWTQVPFNFVIFVAALQTVPDDYLAAAAIDGAGPMRRFFDIQLPLIAPFVFFAAVINVIEAFTHSFGLIDTLTQGGPGGATNILVYKIFSDGFVGLDLSGSSTLSVIMMLCLVVLTTLQFLFFSDRMGYER
ncbi:binding--dependent transport system inner membrane component family protein [Collimonas fungivorans]|uniref:sn-glycerol-3-phosphate transport system permease protein UgpA n=1 Tax=Collimonas fungivorans TaxID=158899 RepID=A0A127P5M1_9BURK|nr:ABC transporter permease subunit [Collimonas fungivorans]AMO93140.1 binding--dependent transport system inner membrane component family protein [Collimonas fungivorans]